MRQSLSFVGLLLLVAYKMQRVRVSQCCWQLDDCFVCTFIHWLLVVHDCRWKMETHTRTHIVDFFQWLVVVPHFFSIFNRFDGFFSFTTLLLFDVWYVVQCLYYCAKREGCLHHLMCVFVSVVCIAYLFLFICVSYRYLFHRSRKSENAQR